MVKRKGKDTGSGTVIGALFLICLLIALKRIIGITMIIGALGAIVEDIKFL